MHRQRVPERVAQIRRRHDAQLLDREARLRPAALLLGALAAALAIAPPPSAAAGAPTTPAGATRLASSASGPVQGESEQPEGGAAETGERPVLEPSAPETGQAALAASMAVSNQEAAGHAKYRLDASKSFDKFAHNGAWIQGHVDVIKAYPTFGDVYVQYGKPVIGYHDPATEGFAPLNKPEIEAYVAKVKRDMGVGYAGTFVDDVNWSFSPSPGPAANVANLLQAIRQAEPGALIEINSQYHDMWPKMKAGDTNVARALAQVNVVTKEFGVGPSSGISTAQDYAEYMTYADTLRAKGIHVVMTGESPIRVPSMEYNLATCLLISDGGDFVNAAKQRPRRFWRGFGVNVGGALGPRERSSSGLWSRHFTGGVVYTVEPGAPRQTIQLGRRMRSAEWGRVEAVTLGPEQGAVLAG